MKTLTSFYEGPFLHDLGRYYLNKISGVKYFTFSCSGFDVSFVGTELRVHLIATECGKPQGEAGIAVLVDEARFDSAKAILLTKPDEDYVLVDHLPFGPHRVRVYKRTESACSLTGWTRIWTDGYFIEGPKEPRLKIEFYGDSITAGNGSEGQPGDDDFETRTENSLLSYAALASEKLNADFSIIAIGGFAVYKSPWNVEAGIKNIPQMFSFADCTWATNPGNAIPWDNSRFIPDVVVINLGTNDDQYLRSLPLANQPREGQRYLEAMNSFVSKIVATYPKTQVIVSIGMIKVSLVENLLETNMKNFGDNVHYLAFTSLKAGGYMPNGGHPNAAMHKMAAEELTALINSILKKPINK